jgi:hypothetical protein
VIKAESQAVLNTLKEHNFQNASKNGRGTGNNAYAWKGTTLRVMWPLDPKLVFVQMAALVLEIMTVAGTCLFLL